MKKVHLINHSMPRVDDLAHLFCGPPTVGKNSVQIDLRTLHPDNVTCKQCIKKMNNGTWPRLIQEHWKIPRES